MAAPNLVNVTSITGKIDGHKLTTDAIDNSNSAVITCGSDKLLKFNYDRLNCICKKFFNSSLSLRDKSLEATTRGSLKLFSQRSNASIKTLIPAGFPSKYIIRIKSNKL